MLEKYPLPCLQEEYLSREKQAMDGFFSYHQKIRREQELKEMRSVHSLDDKKKSRVCWKWRKDENCPYEEKPYLCPDLHSFRYNRNLHFSSLFFSFY